MHAALAMLALIVQRDLHIAFHVLKVATRLWDPLNAMRAQPAVIAQIGIQVPKCVLRVLTLLTPG